MDPAGCTHAVVHMQYSTRHVVTLVHVPADCIFTVVPGHAGAGGGMVDGAGPVELVDVAVGGDAGGALVDAAASAAICK